MPFILPDLPFSAEALAPTISAETLEFHHGKHHKAYVTKANELVAADAGLQGKSLVELIALSKGSAQPKLFNQVGQIWNHSFYWLGLSPERQQPGPALQAKIDASFGSTDALLTELKAAAVNHFASGWAGLVLEGEQIVVTSWHDADTPAAHGAKPLLILDVWEHAYYIDYRNARPDHLDAVLKNLINWAFVEQNLDGRGVSRADQPG